MVFFDKKSSKTTVLKQTYKILLVDDEKDIHSLSKLVLNNFTYKNKNLEILNAYSGKEAKKTLEENNDIVLILLDVVMETDDAGLLVVKYLREELKNDFTQVILRTGVAGKLTQMDVLHNYGINDYKEKTNFNALSLHTSVLTAIRSYENLKALDEKNEKISKLNLRLENLLSNFDENVLSCQINEDKEVFAVSQCFCILAVLNPKELKKDIFQILKKKDEEEAFLKKIKTKNKDKNTFIFEQKNIRKDASVFYIKWKISAKFDDKDVFLYYLCLCEDITNKKEVQVANDEIHRKNIILSQQSKKSAMGEMIGNIAHQWRQPLNNVSLLIHYLRDNCINLNHKEIEDNVEKCKEQLTYMSKTIDDFSDFLRPTKMKGTFCFKDVFDKVFNITSFKYDKKDITVIKNIDDIRVNSYENELVQALINLLNNAIDALREIKGKRLIFVDVIKKEDEIIITIKDNAKGIKKEVINRVFEPYFTTKGDKDGIGIGLYMTQEVIENKLQGHISVKNQCYTYEDKNYTGALFTITLPLS